MDPASAVRTIVVCSLAIQLYAVWKLRESIRWDRLWPLIFGGASTLPVGVWLLLRLDASMFGSGARRVSGRLWRHLPDAP